jgi:micrococcal nuclease
MCYREWVSLFRTGLMKIIPLTIVLLLLWTPFSPAETLTCTRVVDSTHIILNTGEKVRLIGVALPETRHPGQPFASFAKEARAFTEKMVKGKEVRLEYDLQNKDEDGRHLAYVYLEDGTLLNAEIIKGGYGRTDRKFPCKYLEEFRQYEKEAREHQRGLWAQKPPKKETDYIREFYMGSKYSTIYHMPHCTLIRKVNPLDRKMFNSVKDAVAAGYLPCKICKPPYYK